MEDRGREVNTRKRSGRRIALGLAGLLLSAVLLLGALLIPDAKALLRSKDTLTANAAEMLSAAKALDPEGAETAADAILTELRADAAVLEKPIWRLAEKLPVAGGDLRNLRRLLTLGESGVTKLLLPALEYAKELPELPELNELKNDPLALASSLDTGAWLEAAERGLALLEKLLPAAEELLPELEEFPAMRLKKLEEPVGQLRKYAAAGGALLPPAETLLPLLRDELLPCAGELKAVGPLEELFPEEGIVNVTMLIGYLDVLEELTPVLRTLPEKLAFLNDSGAAEEAFSTLNKALTLYDRAEPYLPLLRAFLGSGEDRLYLLAAQNTAEIRALGGYPGAAGYLRVENGILKLDKLTTGYSVFTGQSFVTGQEITLFLEMAAEGRDMVVVPYFPIVASRWAENYTRRTHVPVSGCISVTPAVLSDLLYVTGPLELSDGTVVDGENVIRFIGHDIYVKYLQTYNKNLSLTDELFREIAVNTLSRMFEDITMDKLSRYIDIFEKRCADRVIMLWLNDEEGEALVKEAGCDGGFNTDPTHPQLGVYFNNYFASKLGWYLDLDVDIGAPAVHEDGSADYPVTVRVVNTLKGKEIAEVGQFIIAQTGGTMGAQLYFSAPALAHFSNWKAQCAVAAVSLNNTEYYGSEFLYTWFFFFPPEGEATVTFTVTTAPGEQELLTYVTTPTYQSFR